ncbi:MAG: hypothetical protein AAGG48_03100 [Planctomycetota bacterium]
MTLKSLTHCLGLASLVICCAGCHAIWPQSLGTSSVAGSSEQLMPKSPWPISSLDGDSISNGDDGEIANPSLVRVAKQLNQWQEPVPKPQRLPQVPASLPSRFEPMSITSR